MGSWQHRRTRRQSMYIAHVPDTVLTVKTPTCPTGLIASPNPSLTLPCVALIYPTAGSIDEHELDRTLKNVITGHSETYEVPFVHARQHLLKLPASPGKPLFPFPRLTCNMSSVSPVMCAPTPSRSHPLPSAPPSPPAPAPSRFPLSASLRSALIGASSPGGRAVSRLPARVRSVRDVRPDRQPGGSCSRQLPRQRRERGGSGDVPVLASFLYSVRQ